MKEILYMLAGGLLGAVITYGLLDSGSAVNNPAEQQVSAEASDIGTGENESVQQHTQKQSTLQKKETIKTPDELYEEQKKQREADSTEDTSAVSKEQSQAVYEAESPEEDSMIPEELQEAESEPANESDTEALEDDPLIPEELQEAERQAEDSEEVQSPQDDPLIPEELQEAEKI